jgi:hypothetical protein
MKRIEFWEFSINLYPGFLLGFRVYEEVNGCDYVLYLPFVDLCLTVEY